LPLYGKLYERDYYKPHDQRLIWRYIFWWENVLWTSNKC